MDNYEDFIKVICDKISIPREDIEMIVRNPGKISICDSDDLKIAMDPDLNLHLQIFLKKRSLWEQKSFYIVVGLAAIFVGVGVYFLYRKAKK